MDLRNLYSNAKNIEARSAGDTIFAKGDPGEVMYVLLEGEVDIQIKGQSVYKAGPGEVFGEMALMDSNVRSATAKALNGCQLAPVDERRFQFMVQQTPFFALVVKRVLVSRLRRMDSLV